MIFEIILAVFIGILAGTLTGLTPGIHINLVAAGLLASLGFGFVAGLEPLSLAVFITGMAITHTFIDFIPSVFLGAPDEDTFLTVLPGHELFKEGQGHQAVVLTLYGSLIALPVILLLVPVFTNYLPGIFSFSKVFIPWILIFISLALVLREERPLLGVVIFLMSGFLGMMTFNLPIKEPLLPLLSGLFGLSALIISLNSRSVPSKQEVLPLKKIKLGRKSWIKGTLAGIFVAPLASFLPGIGSGHASVIGSEVFPQDRKGFIFLTGIVNTIVMGLSFITVFSIGKTRTGAAAAVKDILVEISLENLFVILGVISIVSILAFFIGLNLSKLASNYIDRVNYSGLTLGVISILLIVNLILTNWLGLIVLLGATSLGVFAIESRSRRINLMGALILPTIVFYLV